MAGLDGIPSTHQALVAVAGGGTEVRDDIQVPARRENEVLVEVKAVAVNPVDWKTLAYSCTPGAVSRCDFAGVVCGPSGDAAQHQWEQGARVVGYVMGGNAARASNGAFAQYVAAKADLLIGIPESIPFEAAVGYGMSVGTGGLALFKRMGLSFKARLVTPSSPSVLVYGGSTSSGAIAIQLLRVAGYRALAVCSPSNFDMVRRLGAVEAFDYHDPDCGAHVRAYTFNQLEYALDCISTSASAVICFEGLRSQEHIASRYVSLDPVSPKVLSTRPEVRADWILAFTLLGDLVALEGPFRREPSLEDYGFGRWWFREAEHLLKSGEVKSHPAKVMTGGLAGISEGLLALQMGQVSAFKQVYLLGR